MEDEHVVTTMESTSGEGPVPVLRIEGLSKTFPGQQVLFDVDLDVDAGEVHAIVGHNGSGKSTLVKILAGYHRPDDGSQACVAGTEFLLGDPGASHAVGIRFVHQDLGLVPTISVVDNLALGSGFETGRLGKIRWKNEIRRARASLGSLGFDIDVEAPVSTLSIAQRTGVAIARALGHQEDARLLVLDEPTAALPLGETSRLFDIIRGLRDRGIGILLITHHIDEVLDIADRASIFRNGRRVATVARSDLDPDRLVAWIVGRQLEPQEHLAALGHLSHKESLLDVQRMTGGDVVDFTLSVASGEIVGIAGLSGSGRESIAGLLSGRIPRSGSVAIAGETFPGGDPRAAKRAGVALVPGDRASFGVVASMNLRENLTLGDLGRHTRCGRTSKASERCETEEWIKRLGVVTKDGDAPITTLSGGNQQKVLFGRALRLSPRIFVLDDPTAGVDVGAKSEVHAIIEQAAREGAAVVLATTDTDELVRLCDRVVVMRDGRVTRVIQHSEGLDAATIDHAQLV